MIKELEEENHRKAVVVLSCIFLTTDKDAKYVQSSSLRNERSY